LGASKQKSLNKKAKIWEKVSKRV